MVQAPALASDTTLATTPLITLTLNCGCVVQVPPSTVKTCAPLV